MPERGGAWARDGVLVVKIGDRVRLTEHAAKQGMRPGRGSKGARPTGVVVAFTNGGEAIKVRLDNGTTTGNYHVDHWEEIR